MAKLIDKGNGYFSFYCPGCRTYHTYQTNRGLGVTGPCWSFNGNLENPSFNPSLLNTWGRYADPSFDESDLTEEQKSVMSGRCHLFVTNGMIHYCGDCTHDHNGKQDVTMVDLPRNESS